ncbi:MAG: hypothetical protein IIC58_12380 [Proteobacteria bacterium]|nr:hypothetical protein [Pseudomonadota bacterium]
MLILLAVYLFGGGVGASLLTPAAIDEIGERVEVIVTDSARSEAALQTLTELKDEVESFNKLVSKSDEELRDLYEDHGADANEMITIVDESGAVWQASQVHAIELRFQLKASLTAEEWAAVFVGE